MLLCISINLPYAHVWNTVAMSGLVPLVATSNCYKSHKNEYERLLVLHLLLLLNPWVIVEMWPAYVFHRYYFIRCFSELAQLILLTFSWGRSTHYSDRLHDFSVTIPRCYRDVCVNSFFPCIARLWNSPPIECFPLSYDLSGFKSRIQKKQLKYCWYGDYVVSALI